MCFVRLPPRTLVHMRLAAGRFRIGTGVLSVAKLTVGQEAYYEQLTPRPEREPLGRAT
jgi:hypothetical protein